MEEGRSRNAHAPGESITCSPGYGGCTVQMDNGPARPMVYPQTTYFRDACTVGLDMVTLDKAENISRRGDMNQASEG